MATISTNATGNWSASGTWVGGVKPQAGDDVVLLAGHIVTLDENAVFATLTLGLGATGYVSIPAGSTRVMTGDIGWGTVNVTGSRVVLAAPGTGTNLTINGNITRGGNANTRYTIDFATMVNTSLTINGNIVAGATGGNAYAVFANSWTGGTITINGNITGPTTSSGGGGVLLQACPTTNVFVTGNIDGGTGSGNFGLNYNGTPTTGTLTMVGNISGGSSGNVGVAWLGNVSFQGQLTSTVGNGFQVGWGTVTITNTIQAGGTGQCLYAAPAVGQTLTVTAPAVIGGASGYSVYFVGAGTLNLTAPITGSASGTTPAVYQGVVNSTLNLVGSVTGSTGYWVLNQAAAGNIMNVTGDVVAGSGTNARGIHLAGSLPVLTVNGNLTAGAGAAAALQISGTATVTINGTATPSATGHAIAMGSVSYNPSSYYVYELKGGPWAGSGTIFYAVDQATTVNFWRCKRFTCGTNGALPLPGGIVRMIPDGPENRASFYNSSTGLPLVLTDTGYNVGHPAMADVRAGVSYALGAGLGTLAVPSPSLVSYGVPTDNTTGTAILTQSNVAAAVWDAARSGHQVPGSYGATSEWAAAVDLNPVQTVVNAIKLKTDNLPGDPADQSEVAVLIATVLLGQADLADLVALVQERTDNLPDDPADQSSVAADTLAARDAVINAITDLQDLSAAEVQQAALEALEDYGAATGDDVDAIDLQPILDAIAGLDDATATAVWAGLTAEIANRLADHVLRRKQAEVLASPDGDTIDDAGSLYGVGQMHLRANTVDNPGKLTIYNPDDTELAQLDLDNGPAEPTLGVG